MYRQDGYRGAQLRVCAVLSEAYRASIRSPRLSVNVTIHHIPAQPLVMYLQRSPKVTDHDRVHESFRYFLH